MRFERIRLRNFKCYAETELSLREGVTVIHGVNGSGKSSLLEACFFALYGSAAIDGTLDDAIANDADEMSIELWFTHGGGEYRIERNIKRRGGSAQTTTCLLETPNGTVEQVTDVEAHIEELLRMDADAFVNCAYVRQGEVNKLINATPSERQDMIDSLLQLGTLEEYRERASDARVGVERVLSQQETLLEDKRATIAEKEQKSLHDRLNALRTELSELKSDIETKEEERETAVETKQEAVEVLEAYEQRREEIETLEADIEELTEDIAAAESERDALGERLRSLRETTETLRERRDDALAETELERADAERVEERLEELSEAIEGVRETIEEKRLAAQEHLNDAESATDDAEAHRERATEARNEAATLESDIESARETLETRESDLDELDEEIETLREELEGEVAESDDGGDIETRRERLSERRDELRETLAATNERLAERRADLQNARERVEEAAALLEAGNCPECGQPIEDESDVEGLEDAREQVGTLETEVEQLEAEVERLEADHERAVKAAETAAELQSSLERRQDVESLLDQQRETIAEKETRAESLREQAADHETEAEAAEERAQAAEERAQAAREAIGELNGRKADLDERRERLETVASLLADIAENESDIESLRERREHLTELNDQRRERLDEKRTRKAELEAEFDDAAVTEAKAQKQRAEEYIDEVASYLETKREERDKLQSDIGAVKNELEELEALRERRDELEATVERLRTLRDEARTLQDTYADLRSELRQQNVERLEAMLNEIFELVYQNDSYARIELDGDYELTVYQKDGTPLDPDQLSGGERAIFNLSLRCAIYRLLSEGIDGESPTPPLILDEPTVFLDAGHVSKLVELVESMTDHGVEQIIVVSHDDELAGAADDLVAVRKNPTTNRSSVERSATTEALP
ncbi:DNA double-strand break repair ATPase Rad50 [Natronomonas pharaonis DSM 2160]|uniref:DNA double-strand break repair Rad50 ATPase n=1 Tax=Natronomonas pharaonis (strain ATCC 35678 / DSM 2160 / CIP 103997 / JCM 8858 / NBRC 14720 / NCIMB 2260 / Gabara) TaxID=348780 RepID=A0A1U7EV18_NATPD|nr:DNA double-strand break repair ATPase Rad50 [Natronomonas pharaonis]CAI48849.1 DNA double-strand break repair ATPase Rad50 [Natronomonas pharaonis DSM 2160]